MGTISVSLPSDGQTIDAADYNVPINTIVAAINGNIDSNNILAGGVVPNSLTSGTGTSWVWQTWTPTWTNFTVGNGTVVASYAQIGKTVVAKIKVTLGSTSSMGTSPSFSLPVTGSSAFVSYDMGTVYIEDATITGYQGVMRYASTTTGQPVLFDSASTYTRAAAITSTVPFTWGTADFFAGSFTYEAA